MSSPGNHSLETLLLAMAVGDSLGFPSEGLSRGRIKRLGWNRWRQRFWRGQGVTSDDTDHAMLTVSALVSSGGDLDVFKRTLAHKLVRWFYTFPPGVGSATARACLKLSVGVSPGRSGVYSAGNGPAMRSPVLGAAFARDTIRRQRFVEASTRLTHTDPRALTGALAVAECVAAGQRGEAGEPSELIDTLYELSRAGDREWEQLVDQIRDSLAAGAPVEQFAASIGAREQVSGYIYRSVPVAIYAWLRHRHDFRKSLTAVLSLGGDTDTTGAIHAAIAAADISKSNPIPRHWKRIWRYPTQESEGFTLNDIMEEALTTDDCTFYFRDPWLAAWLQNIAVFWMVLWHGLVVRRLPAALARKMIR